MTKTLDKNKQLLIDIPKHQYYYCMVGPILSLLKTIHNKLLHIQVVETFIVRGESIGPKPCSNFSQTSLFLTASEYLKKDIHESYVHAPWHPPTIQLKEQHASYAKRTQARHIRVGLFRGDPLIKKKLSFHAKRRRRFMFGKGKKMSLD